MKSLTTIFSLILILNPNLQPAISLRILNLFPFQSKSHYMMCEEVSLGLAAKGHQVDLYSHFPPKTAIPNLRYISLQGTLPHVMNNLTFENARQTSISQMLKIWLEDHGTATCRLLEMPIFQKLLREPPKDPAYDLVITELSITSCYIPFGRHLNVPVIVVVTPPLLDWHYEQFGTPINLATTPSVFSSAVPPLSFLERVVNVMTFYTAKQGLTRYTVKHDRIMERVFGAGLPNSMDLQKDVALVLVNHDATLSGVKPLAPMVIPVGGLHIVDHNDSLPEVVQKWLDESKHGCVYFSFGSMTRIETFPKHILDAFYKSFVNIAPVRVLLKIAKPRELPPGLPSNVMTQSWLQQAQVLKHKNVKVFVTHGGLMGTQESIHYGVPMLGIPLFGDQLFNVASYVKKKIAVSLKLHEITEKSFTNVLKEVLYNPQYKKTAEDVSRKFRDRPMSPMETATFWVEYIARHGKDALRSPTVDMPWWQVWLLDVYGFILALVLLVLYIVWRIVRIVIEFLIPNVRVQTGSKLKKSK